MRLAAAVLLCAGCTEVFGVHHVGVPIDAVDAPPDVDCATLIDFDGDCIADDVDNCPANANPGQEDTDMPADGVGDACDPHPTLPGDRIVFFASFRDPSAEMPMWLDLAGTPYWTFIPGVAQHTSLSDAVGTIQHAGSIDGAPSVTVEASFTLHAFAGETTNTPRIAVILDSPPDSYNGQSCFVTAYDNNSTPPTNYDSAVLEDLTGFGHSIDLPMQTDGNKLVLRLTRETDNMYCHVVHDTTQNDSIPFVPRTGRTWPTGGQVGVSAIETNADVHYVIVYASS